MFTQPTGFYNWQAWCLPQTTTWQFQIQPMSFFARKAVPQVKAAEKFILGFTNAELRSMNKKSEDDDLDEDLYDMKKKLGRRPREGEYVIRVSLAKGDVRIVRTLSEKRAWDAESLAPATMLFKKYRAILDSDGIHARVELDPNSLLVKKCPNCGTLIPIDDIDVGISDQAVFCNSECKKEYAKKKQLKEEELSKVHQEISQQSRQRIEKIRRMIRGDYG